MMLTVSHFETICGISGVFYQDNMCELNLTIYLFIVMQKIFRIRIPLMARTPRPS